MLSVAAAAQKWAQNMGQAGPAIAAGVDAVRVAPGQLAAAQKGAYLQGVQASADTWAQNVAAVPLPAWQQAMKTKGVQNLAAGIAGGQAKWNSAMNRWFPVIDQIKQSLPARQAAGNNTQRMLQFSQAMHAAKQSMG